MLEAFFTPRNVLALTCVLFSLGCYGVLARRNLLVILMSLELMLVAVNIALVLFSRMQVGDVNPAAVGATFEMARESFRHAHTGQVFTLMVMTVAAGEVGVGLAIAVTLYRARHSLETDQATELRL